MWCLISFDNSNERQGILQCWPDYGNVDCPWWTESMFPFWTLVWVSSKRTCPWWLRQYYLHTFKTRSDTGLWHKSYTSYPTIRYVNPCWLIPGQRRAVAGDVKPCRIQCDFSRCQVKPPTGHSRLSARYSRTDLRAACHLIYLHKQTYRHTHTHTHIHRTYFLFHVLFCFQWNLLLSHFIFRWGSHPAFSKWVQQYKELHLLDHQHLKQPINKSCDSNCDQCGGLKYKR